GSFERTVDPCSNAAPKFENHRAFRSLPNINFDAPNVQLIDLNGDGFADVLVADGSRFTWYPSLGRDGFGAPHTLELSRNQAAGPQLIWSDPRQAMYFSDMTGDGLSDIIRVRNGETVYWPNIGYGRFGRQIVMRGSPHFDRPDVFHTSRLRIGDIDGTGTTDFIYIGAKGAAIYRNLAGNAFAQKYVLAGIPQLDTMAYVELADILGKGTTALVWTTDAPSQQGAHVRYVDLLAAGKPYLLVGVQNGMGLETKVRYAPSTKFYLEDRAAGRPWKTRLPFPVHVIERTETRDHITGHTFVQTYKYHHGHFDGVEREFRGFGMVEVEDTESFDDYNDPELFPSGHEIVDEALHVPPVLTKTWFHTGLFLGEDSLSRCYADEYYSDKTQQNPNGIAVDLADTLLPDGITAAEKREAARTLRGRALRVEVYSLDGSDQEQHPYTVAETNFSVRLLQPRSGQPYAAFFVHDRESLS
ncbi:MAG: toxin TcdB middle/N-terminal domain-containing protein, partial [Nannocystaceae bacterium]